MYMHIRTASPANSKRAYMYMYMHMYMYMYMHIRTASPANSKRAYTLTSPLRARPDSTHGPSSMRKESTELRPPSPRAATRIPTTMPTALASRAVDSLVDSLAGSLFADRQPNWRSWAAEKPCVRRLTAARL